MSRRDPLPGKTGAQRLSSKIYRAIKQGRLSATTGASGRQIDVAELIKGLWHP